MGSAQIANVLEDEFHHESLTKLAIEELVGLSKE